MGEFFSFVIFGFQVLDMEHLLFYNWGKGGKSGQTIQPLFLTQVWLGHCS